MSFIYSPVVLICFIVSFIAGVAVAEVSGFGVSISILFFSLSVYTALIGITTRNMKDVFVVSCVLLGLSFGVFRFEVFSMKQSAHTLDPWVNETIVVDGVVVEEPDIREEYVNIVLEPRRVLYENKKYVLDGRARVLVRTGAYPELWYGDEVSVRGRLVLPKNFTSDDGKNFDYRGYLAKDEIYYQIYYPRLTIAGHQKGNKVRGFLLSFKRNIVERISQAIPEPEASLAAGITLGAKQSLGEELLQKFRETGVAHIVVLSGYNIAVVAAIISRIFSVLPFAVRLIASGFAMVLFAVMVGGGATVVRATVMALVVIGARLLGRGEDAFRALVIAGGVMVLFNPMILLHDISFQLSFMATLAIAVFAPILERHSLFIRSRVFREIVVSTVATQVFVLPLVLYHMGTVSLVGLIANIFVLPVIPVAMLMTAFVVVLAGVPVVGGVVAFATYALLAYVMFAVGVFARVPYAALHDIPFSLGALFVTYVCIGGFVVRNVLRESKTKISKHEF